MKYQLVQLLTDPPKSAIQWPGFSLEVSNENAAAKLVDELNRLDVELVRTRRELEAVKRDLTLQIEAKNNYISLAASFVTAIRDAQRILAEYIEPRAVPLGPKAERAHIRHALTELLGVLDHRDLVALVKGSSLGKEHIRKGSTMTAVHPLLGVVDLPVKPTLNDWEDATHQITFDGGKHWTNVELDGDCFTACSDGKRSWSVDSIVPANVVARPGDPVKSIVDAAEMGTTIHETLNRLTKAISETQLAPMITTNHFAPKPKASKKQLAALQYAIDKMVDPATVKSLRKLLKKLS